MPRRYSTHRIIRLRKVTVGHIGSSVSFAAPRVHAMDFSSCQMEISLEVITQLRNILL
jgi:hypothetical protein